METNNPFEKVLDRLREKGWVKFTPGPEKGPNCVNGALWYECGLDEDAFIMLRNWLGVLVVEHYRNRTTGNSEWANPEFNNHPDTTFEDVERVLEKASVKWEEERVIRHD